MRQPEGICADQHIWTTAAATPLHPSLVEPAIVDADVYDVFAEFRPPQQLEFAKPVKFVPERLGAFDQISETRVMGTNGVAHSLPALSPGAVVKDVKMKEQPATTTDASQESSPPSTPEERRKGAYLSTMPKLDRTMTDVYSDELYNPSFQITSAPPATSTSQPSTATSPQSDVFSQRLQAANSQHLSANNSQTQASDVARDRSPFRQGSPLAPVPQALELQTGFASTSQLRKQQKADRDDRLLQEQLARVSPSQEESKTISPKDVDLVYRETAEDRAKPLFPSSTAATTTVAAPPLPPPPPIVTTQQPPASSQQPPLATTTATATASTTPRTLKPEDSNDSEPSFRSMATTRQDSTSSVPNSSQNSQPRTSFSFTPTIPAIPQSMRMPNHYPFVPVQRRESSNISQTSNEFPPSLRSLESPTSDQGSDSGSSSDLRKPAGTSADTGTYTCTYHGCTLRFDTPGKLQRHKRDGHRNTTAVVNTEPEARGMTSTAQSLTQAGPHKCERINPSTGKPCNTVFSRPYDLTRHEDTIHNARKKKVRCDVCTEEKTFSRNDALTRHYRVCHPEVDLTKSRKKSVM